MSRATRGKKNLDHPYSIHRERRTRTKLSLALHLANLAIIPFSWFLLTSKNWSRKYQWLAQYGSGLMMRMPCYMTVLRAQNGICSGIHPMALRSIPPQPPASSIQCIWKVFRPLDFFHILLRYSLNLKLIELHFFLINLEALVAAKSASTKHWAKGLNLEIWHLHTFLFYFLHLQIFLACFCFVIMGYCV
jgi:hypothetical protein